MKLPALAMAAALFAFPASAENIMIACPLVQQYSEDQVSYLLNQARSVISEQEVGKIYHRYLSLKNACHANAKAYQVVFVSPTLRSWLAQNGVDMSKIGRQL
jgi:hypothetical protein